MKIDSLTNALITGGAGREAVGIKGGTADGIYVNPKAFWILFIFLAHHSVLPH